MAQSSFDFVESIYTGALAKRADTNGIESLSGPEKNIVLAWWAKGEIDNGGFAFLYSKPVNIDDVALAFRNIGFESAYKACIETKAVFPDGKPPDAMERRLKIIEELDKSGELWKTQERVIWEMDVDFDDAVAEYAKSHGLGSISPD